MNRKSFDKLTRKRIRKSLLECVKNTCWSKGAKVKSAINIQTNLEKSYLKPDHIGTDFQELLSQYRDNMVDLDSYTRVEKKNYSRLFFEDLVEKVNAQVNLGLEIQKFIHDEKQLHSELAHDTAALNSLVLKLKNDLEVILINYEETKNYEYFKKMEEARAQASQKALKYAIEASSRREEEEGARTEQEALILKGYREKAFKDALEASKRREQIENARSGKEAVATAIKKRAIKNAKTQTIINKIGQDLYGALETLQTLSLQHSCLKDFYEATCSIMNLALSRDVKTCDIVNVTANLAKDMHNCVYNSSIKDKNFILQALYSVLHKIKVAFATMFKSDTAIVLYNTENASKTMDSIIAKQDKLRSKAQGKSERVRL